MKAGKTIGEVFMSEVKESTEPSTKTVMLRGVISAVEHGNGDVTITVWSKPLMEQEREMIRKLFPNLTEQVFELLDKEALLSCLD